MAPVKQQATAAASGQGKDAECVLEQKGNVVWTKWRNGSGKCEGKPSGGPGRATGSGMLEQRHIYAHYDTTACVGHCSHRKSQRKKMADTGYCGG
eukprot:scaffold142675_cov27-Tisochrysis_lutea.AAC.1